MFMRHFLSILKEKNYFIKKVKISISNTLIALIFKKKKLTFKCLKKCSNQIVWALVARSSFVLGEYRVRFSGGTTLGQYACLYTQAGLVIHLWCVGNRCKSKKNMCTFVFGINARGGYLFILVCRLSRECVKFWNHYIKVIMLSARLCHKSCNKTIG